MIKQDFPRQLFWCLFFTFVYLPLLLYLIQPWGKKHSFTGATSFREPLDAWMLEKRPCDERNEHSCAYHNHTCVFIDHELPVHNKQGELTGETVSGATCIPVQNKCNPYTSNSLLVDLGDGKYDYMCDCLYDDLVTKEGGDCNVVKACGIGGSLLPATRPIGFDPLKEGRCACPEGFVATHDNQRGPACVPKTWRNSNNLLATKGYNPLATKGYLLPSSSSGYSKDQPEIYLPMPCKWNMIEPHEYHDENEYVDGYGCVCDYNEGWVGIRATDADTGDLMAAFDPNLHFNGCINLEVEAGNHTTRTDFFKRNSDQVTVHEYELKPDSTLARIVESTKVQVAEPWSFTRHDYFQRMLEYATDKRQLHCVRYEAYFEDSPDALIKFPNTYLLFPLSCEDTKADDCGLICRSKSGKYNGLIILNPNVPDVTRLDTTFDKLTKMVKLDKFNDPTFQRAQAPEN